jgi:hypothetical protein
LVNIFDVFLPQLLLYPNPSDPLNGEAAALLLSNKKQYAAKVEGFFVHSSSILPSTRLCTWLPSFQVRSRRFSKFVSCAEFRVKFASKDIKMELEEEDDEAAPGDPEEPLSDMDMEEEAGELEL